MNGKPQLVFGQAQLAGSNALMNKANYAKSSLMPVRKGNSFASILSSTVDKSNPAAVPAASRLVPGGQGSFLAGAGALFGGGVPSGGVLHSTLAQSDAIPGNDRQLNTAGGSSAVTKIGGATVQAATQANTLGKRVSIIPKNYSFGMEDTRPAAVRSAGRSSVAAHSVRTGPGEGGVKKTPVLPKTVSSARAINVAARQGTSSGGSTLPIAEQLAAANGTFRDTPYRGLAISHSGMEQGMLNSLNKKNGSGTFFSPLLMGGATQLLIQIVKEVGHAVGTVGDKLRLKGEPPLARATPVMASRTNGGKNTGHATTPASLPGLTAPAQNRSVAGIAASGVLSGVQAGISGFPMSAASLGALSAKFESGESGIAAIGYDRHGGTSYGKYQISSRAGTFSKFLEYLDVNAPDIGARLRAGGPANTGSRRGKMPEIWKSVAQSEPERFEQLQTDFIMNSHFQPAMSAITESTGIAFASMPEALREVVFSTAVQHGVSGAAKIISRAVASVGAEKLTEGEKAFVERSGQDLIRQIYNIRAGQFSSSTSSVRRAVQNRLQHEMYDALALLRVNAVPQRPDTRHLQG